MVKQVNPTIIPATEPLQVGELFAVYGTLRKGCGNYQNLGLETRAEFIGLDEVDGTLYHLGGFPGLTEEASDTPVAVEVYKLTDANLSRSLDMLEGYHTQAPNRSMYIRAKTVTKGGLEVDIYYYNNNDVAERNAVIKSGDWLTS